MLSGGQRFLLSARLMNPRSGKPGLFSKARLSTLIRAVSANPLFSIKRASSVKPALICEVWLALATEWLGAVRAYPGNYSRFRISKYLKVSRIWCSYGRQSVGHQSRLSRKVKGSDIEIVSQFLVIQLLANPKTVKPG